MNNTLECDECHSTGLQIEFKEHYQNNWEEYGCKVCGHKFMRKNNEKYSRN